MRPRPRASGASSLHPRFGCTQPGEGGDQCGQTATRTLYPPVVKPVAELTSPSQDLDFYVEWGGAAWKRLTAQALGWMGDLTGCRVLDLGTRSGRMSCLFAELGATVRGLDVSATAFAEAEALANELGVADRVMFETYSGDLHQLPSRSFDIVFTKSVLVLFEDLDAAWAELSRSLTQRGRIVALENMRGPSLMHLLRMIGRHSRRPHGASYFTPESVDSARRYFDLDLVETTLAPPICLLAGRKLGSA